MRQVTRSDFAALVDQFRLLRLRLDRMEQISLSQKLGVDGS